MRKKIIYIGLALIAIAIASFFISGSLLGSSIRNGIMAENLTVHQGSYASLPITMANRSVLVVQASLSKPAYIYIFNNVTFSRWVSGMNTVKNFSGISYARLILPNNSFIGNPSSLAELVYPKNLSALSSAENRSIDVVVDNTNGSPSSNGTVAAQLEWVQVGASAIGPYQIVNVINILLFIAGIIVVAYGAIKKRPEAQGGKPGDGKANVSQEYVDALYKNVDRAKGHPAKKKTRR
ncbi:MAG: hypothetical protein KGH60_02545 [Candidatus Micrarchaeota archaeon]|nr:hypothetical protein [Candidatus Micrarchaeota archaeon]